MNLSPEQIQQLYKFTKAHFVEHYDLQTELVDHLANGIEEQIKLHPKLTFQEALNIEFKKFGVFGFHDVIRDKTKAMEKRYWKILWSFYKEYFKPPKVLMLIVATLVVFTAMIFLPEGYKGYLISILFTAVMAIIFVKTYRNRKQLKKKKKKWMLEDMILNNSNSLVFLNLGLQVCIYPHGLEGLLQNSYIALILAFLLTFMLLVFYIMVYIIPPMTEDLLIKTYPEYKMG